MSFSISQQQQQQQQQQQHRHQQHLQLHRGSSCSSSFSSSQFVVQVDGQEWDVSNLVPTSEGISEPPPPPFQLEQPNNSSSSDDSSMISDSILAVVSPSPPLPRQRKQAPQRQSSLTSFCAQTYYPKQHELLQDHHEDYMQHHHPERRRTRQDMEVVSSSGFYQSPGQIVEGNDEDADMMNVDQHDVFRSLEPSQPTVQNVVQQRCATFDDCSSLSSNSAMMTTVTSPRLAPPPSATTWIEVMPQQFLPLVGDSFATWQAITQNNVHQVSCAICHTQQYCMTTISTVFCASCRSLFPNTHFVSGPGGLGLGMPMDDAHRELKRRNVKRPPSGGASQRTVQAAHTTSAPSPNSGRDHHTTLQLPSDEHATHRTRRSCASSSGSAKASFRNMAAATTTPH